MKSNYFLFCLISHFLIERIHGSDFFQSFGGRNPFGTTNMGSKEVKDDEYYKRLGIDNTATAEQIKKAYRKQAMVSHPDKGGDAEQFKKLNEAYEVLSDSEKRVMYDRHGKDGLNPNMGGSGSPFGFGDVFRGFSTFSMPVMMQLDLSLEDLYNGKEIKIPVRAGTFAKIKIEPGMMAGQQLMLRGQLVDSKGSPRDVIFRLNELAHSTFQRRNADLLIDLKISLREALLGFEKAIKHLDGKEIWIKNRKGEVTSPGEVLMLKDMGMPIYSNPGMRGRLFIRIKVIFPKKQWCDEIQLKELSKLLPPTDPSVTKTRRKRPEEPVVHANPADIRSFGQIGGVTSSGGFGGMGEDDDDSNPFAQFFFR